MALSERVEIGSREVLVNGSIRVRQDTVIEKDGVFVSRTYHRHVVAPGDDITNEDISVQIVAKAVHTPAIVAAYKLSQRNSVLN
tara:strand:- start:17 stop:268 length:252 start_codon:yes stop_codon:yes gene_type:complete